MSADPDDVWTALHDGGVFYALYSVDARGVWHPRLRRATVEELREPRLRLERKHPGQRHVIRRVTVEVETLDL